MNNTKELPAVSILIATRGRRRELSRALESIRDVDYPADKVEIVVVEEADNPQEIEGVKYIFIPRKDRPDFGYARNMAVKNASHGIVVWTDDDCEVTREWLKELISTFREGVAGVAGAIMVKDCNSIGYCESVLGFPGGGLKKIYEAGDRIIETSELSTCNCAYLRKLFDEVGYFREKTPYSGEDYDFAHRITRRYRCLYNPKAVVYHKARQSFIKIFKWFTRRGICEVFLIRLRTNRLFPHLWYNLKNSLLLRLLVLILILKMIGQNRPIVYLGIFAVYYTVILLRYRFQLRVLKSLKVFFLTPVVKMVMDLGMEWGKIIGPFILLKEMRRG